MTNMSFIRYVKIYITLYLIFIKIVLTNTNNIVSLDIFNV